MVMIDYFSMLEDEYVTLRDRCETCAYREGTEANRSVNTMLKAQLCLESGEPFLCHSDLSRRALCRGWVDAFTVKLRKGSVTNDLERIAFLREATEYICDYEDGVLKSQSAEAKKQYEQACAEMDRV